MQRTSFFDDEKSTALASFWNKEDCIQEFSDCTPLFSHTFFKKSRKRSQEVKDVYVCIYKNYLIMSKVPLLPIIALN